METDEITWGECYDISAQAQDADGNSLEIDNTWQAALRVCKGKIGGPAILDVALTIAADAATGSLDTRSEDFTNGIYYYDIRFTDPDGCDYWSAPIQLTLSGRNTPPSA